MKHKIYEGSTNYTASIIRLSNLEKVEGLDKLVQTSIFGSRVLVGVDQAVGDLGVFFPAETKLSNEFLSNNNLFRHTHLNVNPTGKGGFFEDNGRVKSVKFKGVVSNGFWIPINSLDFILKGKELDEGLEFNELEGIEICRKYIRKTKGTSSGQKVKELKLVDLVDSRCTPEHVDTSQLFRNLDKLNLEDQVSITTKLHGTSVRISNNIVYRQKFPRINNVLDGLLRNRRIYRALNKLGFPKIANYRLTLNFIRDLLSKIGIEFKDHDYKYIAASRRVIKSIDFEAIDGKQHYYPTDVWTRAARLLENKLHKGEVIFGEIVGWDGDKVIQHGYSYGIPEGEFKLYVYRISMSNPDGVLYDLSWPQLKERCKQLGVEHVPQIHSGTIGQFMVSKMVDSNYELKFDERNFGNVLEQIVKNDYLDKPSRFKSDDWANVEEGIVLTVEKLGLNIPLKAKSPLFLLQESKNLDDESIVDMEESGDDVSL